MVIETPVMPTKKTPKNPKGAGRKPKETAVRTDLITMRCTPAFKVAVEEIAKSEYRQPSVVIELALRAYAEAGKYKPLPER